MSGSRVIHNIQQNSRERAVLVAVDFSHDGHVPLEESIDELTLLADTAGADVVDRLVQSRDRLDPATFVGSGFAEKVGRRVIALDADLVVFDDDLSPAQVRNLEKHIEAKIVDRSTLILDIFAERAKTREAKTQVGTARVSAPTTYKGVDPPLQAARWHRDPRAG